MAGPGSESPFAYPLEVVVATLAQHQPMFTRAFELGLDLTPAQTEAIAGVDGRIWVDWSMAVLSGEESKPGLPIDATTDLFVPSAARDLIGKTVTVGREQALAFHEGELANRTDALYADRSNASTEKLELVSMACARFMTVMMALVGPNTPRWHESVPQYPQTLLAQNKESGQMEVRFAAVEARHPIEGPTDSVVTYGPGLTGANFVGTLIGKTKEVHLVSGGKGAMFVNAWIGSLLTQMATSIEDARAQGVLARMPMLPKGVPLEDVRVPRQYYYDDGIAAAGGAITAHAAGGRPMDVFVMSAAQSAGPAECLAGVDTAKATLREGGLLVVKGPDISLPGEGGMDVVGAHAARLLGRPVLAGECGTQSQYSDPSLPVLRPASFAIYQK